MKNKILFIGSIILVLISICIGTSIGSSNINIGDTFIILIQEIFNITIDESIEAKDISIIWNLRLPRVLLAFLVGGGLSASGAVVQSILKNQLASPYTLGVSSGSSLGAGLVIITGFSIPLMGEFTLPFTGFLFGVITVYIVILFSSKIDKYMSNNTIILAGMVLSLFLNSLLTTLTALFSKDLKSISIWQMGSFAMKGWSYVHMIIPFLIVGMIGVLKYTKEMDILTFGEEQAQLLGVDTKKIKSKLFIYTSVLTGASVSLSGTIGFIDLIAPHVVRKIFGSSHKYVVPMSFIFGGIFMIFADLISRTIVNPLELPVGSITAMLGAPFFAYVYFKKAR